MRILKNSSDFTIYRILKKECVSGEMIGKKLGISRSAVWKSINKLRNSGIEVVSGKKGYRVSGERELNPYQIADITFGQINEIDEVFYFEEVDSTNEQAKKYGKPGVLFFAETQTLGRGRLGRKWESEKGGIYFTLTLKPKLDYSELPKLTLIAGLSVAETVFGKIKWPNDVLIRGKKVCGILSEIYGEMESPLVILGIGINVLNRIPDGLRDYAASLNEFYDASRKTVFEDVIKNFAGYYRMLLDGKWPELRKRFVRRCDTIGKLVRVETVSEEIIGVAEDIGEDGSLIVDGRKVYAGDCIHLRKGE
ncbi:biotin--[acetyl-CoA-carboxylase] ligase [Archaeoglobus neptunius]|uniref:biotin--[acetyl-CoA-carboxylase] ligase n=1 Tax=Archaeoglobus neptunius TaxID=2798580 RepID=UPI0019266D88|nr:biotin--[acetyl-CoA-carboxylase] ligase [Archaeoglobus neptunius]